MELNDYHNQAARTMNADKMDPVEVMTNGVLGLNGEAGECADILKKSFFQGHMFEPEKLLDELGDVLWYICCTATSIGATLEDVAEYNVKKLKARYPDGFEAERSINREESKIITE